MVQPPDGPAEPDGKCPAPAVQPPDGPAETAGKCPAPAVQPPDGPAEMAGKRHPLSRAYTTTLLR